MGKKTNKNGGEKNNDDQKKSNKDGGKKESSLTVILKTDLHCEGCADKIVKTIRSLEGVETVKRGDGDGNKLTVIGTVDPAKLREKVEKKTQKKVELISPSPKKEKDNDKENQKSKDDGVEDKKRKEKETKDKPEEKKPKEPPLTTAVMKVNLHCEGCIKKIRRIVTRTKGYQEMSVDRAKDLVTVKGSMDMRALAESLKKQLKKNVEVVPPKKEGGGEKKEKGGAGGEKKEKGGAGGGGEQGQKGGGDGNTAGAGGEEGGKMELNNVGYLQYGYPNPNPYPFMHVHSSGYPVDHYYHYPHAPQMFSDENPNACSIM